MRGGWGSGGRGRVFQYEGIDGFDNFEFPRAVGEFGCASAHFSGERAELTSGRTNLAASGKAVVASAGFDVADNGFDVFESSVKFLTEDEAAEEGGKHGMGDKGRTPSGLKGDLQLLPFFPLSEDDEVGC